MNSIVAGFRAEHGREPTVEDVARISGHDPLRVLEAMEAESTRTPMSLDRPAANRDEEKASRSPRRSPASISASTRPRPG